MTTSREISLTPTPESIAAAKQAQQLERAVVTALTGVTFDDDGRMALNMANAIVAVCYGLPSIHVEEKR